MNLEIATILLMAVLVIALIKTTTVLYSVAQQAEEANDEKRILLNRLEATVNRMEKATKVVAENLASSIDRADHADDAIPGASADAALRTGDL